MILSKTPSPSPSPSPQHPFPKPPQKWVVSQFGGLAGPTFEKKIAMLLPHKMLVLDEKPLEIYPLRYASPLGYATQTPPKRALLLPALDLSTSLTRLYTGTTNARRKEYRLLLRMVPQ